MVAGMLAMVGRYQLLRCMVEATSMNFLTFEIKLASHNTFSITIIAQRVRLQSLKELACSKLAPRLTWEAANLVASGIPLEETLTTMTDWDLAMTTWPPELNKVTVNELLAQLGLPVTLQPDLKRFL